MKHKILLDLYNVLVKNEYPEIEKISPENIAKSLLFGNNFTNFLSWVLRLQNTAVYAHLETLKDAALLEELAKIYMNLGMCIETNISSESQLSSKGLQMIETLIIYIKSQNNENAANVSVVNFNRELEEQQREHLFKSCRTLIQTNSPKLSNLNPTIKYHSTEAHILHIKKVIEKCNIRHSKMNQQLSEMQLHAEQVNVEENVPVTDSNSAALFTKTFGNHKWPVNSQSNDQFKKTSQKIGSDFCDIESKFSLLKKTVDHRNQVLSSAVPQNSSLFDSPTHDLEDIVMMTSKVCNSYKQ